MTGIIKMGRCPYCGIRVQVPYRRYLVVPGVESGSGQEASLRVWAPSRLLTVWPDSHSYTFEVVGRYPVCPGACQATSEARERRARAAGVQEELA